MELIPYTISPEGIIILKMFGSEFTTKQIKLVLPSNIYNVVISKIHESLSRGNIIINKGNNNKQVDNYIMIDTHVHVFSKVISK